MRTLLILLKMSTMSSLTAPGTRSTHIYEYIPRSNFQTFSTGGGGGNSLRPYSQQRPLRTNLAWCLGLIDNGQQKGKDRLLVLVPNERPHGIMRILENLHMLLPKALKTRAINLATSAIVSGHPGHPNPALLNSFVVSIGHFLNLAARLQSCGKISLSVQSNAYELGLI